ncbi:Cytochrome P450 monooxygenase [Colletotrichum sp. SAR 10_76]|nr:Cytochrome P450 monooxygenase [Colletotrichum sp. SAR 10_75]KAI8213586.1 Cytochrome P450 monooxygenase [Colletotrichum sp. SAR 10_76]
MNETRSLLRQGYEKYLRQGIPFQIRHPVGELGSQVLLPTKYLEEVKKAPTDLFSFEAYSAKSFLLDYSRAPRQTEAAAHVIRVDLNRNLGPLVTDLWNEAAQHLRENVSFEWKTVSAYELVCSFVARVASVALVGAPLCRNPAWQQIVVETTFVAFGAAQAIKDKYTPRWRWLAPWSESIQKDLRRIRKQSIDLLRPLYKERREAMSNTDSFRDPSEVYRDVVFWLMNSNQKDRSFFMKESARLNPIGFVSTQRYTLKPYTFKDGFHLPAGTTIMFHSDGAHYDADNYPEPDKFDGYRFLRLRETVDANRFHYASVSDSALGFGAGIHACPGRFLSAIVMKFFLINFMTQYEFKYEHGGTERLPNLYNDNTSRPAPTVNLLVRRKY